MLLDRSRWMKGGIRATLTLKMGIEWKGSRDGDLDRSSLLYS